MRFTRTLKNLSQTDVNIAGGKGSALGEMMRAGIPVPQGFVVTAAAWNKFLGETRISATIDATLRNVGNDDIDRLTKASREIQATILSNAIPKDIALEIQERFEDLSTKRVAVRSSATCEDSATDAWAGQLDTYLNTSSKDLLTNVHKCWASLYTPRAISYRFQKGLRSRNISVAVVVQMMVQSEVSGTAFSVHPVTQNSDQILVEAAYGLGEALVSGEITPDSYVIGKRPFRISEKNISEQRVRLDRARKGSCQWKKVEFGKMKRQKLSDAQLLRLCGLVLTLENHYGFPCDIEWAFEKSRLYIVQCRPITTLKHASQYSVFSD